MVYSAHALDGLNDNALGFLVGIGFGVLNNFFFQWQRVIGCWSARPEGEDPWLQIRSACRWSEAVWCALHWPYPVLFFGNDLSCISMFSRRVFSSDSRRRYPAWAVSAHLSATAIFSSRSFSSIIWFDLKGFWTSDFSLLKLFLLSWIFCCLICSFLASALRWSVRLLVSASSRTRFWGNFLAFSISHIESWLSSSSLFWLLRVTSDRVIRNRLAPPTNPSINPIIGSIQTGFEVLNQQKEVKFRSNLPDQSGYTAIPAQRRSILLLIKVDIYK